MSKLDLEIRPSTVICVTPTAHPPRQRLATRLRTTTSPSTSPINRWASGRAPARGEDPGAVLGRDLGEKRSVAARISALISLLPDAAAPASGHIRDPAKMIRAQTTTSRIQRMSRHHRLRAQES